MRHVILNADQLTKVSQQVSRMLLRHKFGILLTAEPYRLPKTNPQNAKLHAMIGELAEHLGYSFDDLRDYLKEQYGPRRTLNIEQPKSVPKSWADLTRDEASALIEHVYRIAAECGYVFQEQGLPR